MPSDQTSTQASDCSFSSGSCDFIRAAFVEVPLSIRKHQPDDGDTVCEIMVALNLEDTSAQAGFIEFYYILFSLVYSVSVVA